LALAAGLAGDEERVVVCQRELAVLTEASDEFIRRWSSGYALWSLGVAAWRRGNLDRAAALEQESLRLRETIYNPIGSALTVAALAWIAGSGQQFERAAALLGAAAGLWRSMGTPPDGFQTVAACQRDCEQQARQALGETAFQAAYDRGLQLSAADAVAYALQRPKKPPARPTDKPRAAAVPGDGLLTPRECEVAQLVAGGRSNKQIAAALVIAQRTAEGHVERILAKLGFTSRAQLAAWVAAAQPDGHRRLDQPLWPAFPWILGVRQVLSG
jgi:DNA-binding CsgD family transcriptional regulator